LTSPQSSSSSNCDANATTSVDTPLSQLANQPQESPTTASISQRLKALQSIIDKTKVSFFSFLSSLKGTFSNYWVDAKF
jgi:hypothetical protein